VTEEELATLIDVVGELREEIAGLKQRNAELREGLYNLHEHHQEQAEEINETVNELVTVVLSEADVNAVRERAKSSASSDEWGDAIPDGAAEANIQRNAAKPSNASDANVNAKLRLEQERVRGQQRANYCASYVDMLAQSPFLKRD
jgi:hypothetical protein